MDETFEEESTVVVLDNKTCKITLRGYEELKNELEKLKEDRAKILIRLQNAKENGDLSENAEYDEAKSSMRQNDIMINDISLTIATRIPISTLKHKDVVDFGAEVFLEVTDQKDNKVTKKQYIIVGELEGNIEENRLSINTPLGQLLLNKGINSTFLFNQKTYKIISIIYDDKNIQ